MNVEKEVDYVDLSTDKTPHYGVVTKVIDSNSFETIECNIFGAPCKIIAMTRQYKKNYKEKRLRKTFS